MKIVFVLENYYPNVGGVETLFQTLAEKLALKHKVVMVTSQQPGAKSLEVYRGVKVVRVKLPPFARRYFFTVLAVPTVLHFARAADVIHTTTYNAALPAWLVGKILRKPVIITVHEVLGNLWFQLPMSRISQLLHYSFEKLIVSLPFSKYIVDSDYTYHCLTPTYVKDRKKVLRIYCGIDYKQWQKISSLNSQKLKRKFFDLPKQIFLLLYFGRPGWVKGVESLVEAFPLVIKKVPKAHLTLILSKEPAGRRRYIEELVHKLNLEGKVRIFPSVDKKELPYFIKSADCVVIPSLSEGFGFSAVESLSLKVPVIARNAGSLREVIDHSWLFSNASQLAELVKKLSDGKHYSFNTNKFLLSKTVAQYEKVYTSVIR